MNPEVSMSLREAVDEVAGQLFGMDLTLDPSLERFHNITRQLNRALRSNALEHEWSWYASTESLGTAVLGDREVTLRSSMRPRIINDDSVRLVDADGNVRVWAYFLPRDALHKYQYMQGLWVSATRTTLQFSRGFNSAEHGLDIQVPVMREPTMFRLPDDLGDEVPAETLSQELDFQYPDVVILRAAFYYAQTDPILQPRVQTLEAQYKDLMYQIIERDDRNTDSPYENEFYVPVQGVLRPDYPSRTRPDADIRR